MIDDIKLEKALIYGGAIVFPFANIKISSMVLLLAFLVWIGKRIFGGKPIVMATLDWAVIAFFLVNVIGSFFSYDPVSCAKQLFMLASLIGAYFVISNEFDGSEVRTLLLLMLFSSIVPILYGYYQSGTLAGNQDLWIDKSINPDLEARIYSVFTNPNIYGEYLVNTFFIALGLLATNKKKTGKILLALFCLAITYQIILTYSRGAWITYVAGLGLFLLAYNWKFIAAFIPLGIGALAFSPVVVKQRIGSIINGFQDSSFYYRVEIWKNAIEMIKVYGLTGLGYGYQSFHQYYAHYKTPGYNATHSHNVFLQVWLESGIVGFLLFIYIVLSVIAYNLKAIMKSGIAGGCKELISLAIIIAILLHGMIDYTLFDYRITFQFWMALSLTAFSVKEKRAGQ
ncbi:MAG: O-antigen ligase family protein [Peptostreptococcaceae bacterium]|nr:O-antigen ligase family protein [Peptostreptococcaceae bacterium]